MARIVVSEFVTVDGVMEDPGGGEDFALGGWAFEFERGAEGDQFKVDELMASDALLLGRVTYEAFASAWPGREDEASFGQKFNSMPKYVASTTLSEPLEWDNSHLLKGDTAEAIRTLKEETDGDILVNGSAMLVQTLVEHDLVDAYNLMVFPTVLGTGKRLFAEGARVPKLKLVDSRPVGADGVVILTYEPVRQGT